MLGEGEPVSFKGMAPDNNKKKKRSGHSGTAEAGRSLSLVYIVPGQLGLHSETMS